MYVRLVGGWLSASNPIHFPIRVLIRPRPCPCPHPVAQAHRALYTRKFDKSTFGCVTYDDPKQIPRDYIHTVHTYVCVYIFCPVRMPGIYIYVHTMVRAKPALPLCTYLHAHIDMMRGLRVYVYRYRYVSCLVQQTPTCSNA